MRGQLYLEFFDPSLGTPSIEARRAFLDPANPVSPYFGFIGNRRAVDRLIRIDFEALGRSNHVCNDLNIAFIGQAGCGKTEIARRHAKANQLSLVELSPKSIKSTHDIFRNMGRVLAEAGLPLVELGRVDRYVPPPVNVFIDEVHALTAPVVDGLLKATEHNDGVLVTERGITVDCKNVHWLIATTERGKLFDAFDTRFTKCILNLYTKDEIAKIVQVHNPDWDMSVCRLVAHFCGRIPREALAFAREMQLEHNMNPNDSWRDVAYSVAEDNEIDPLGMTYTRLAIIKALGHGPIAEKRLPMIAGCKSEELDKFILPWLLATTDDQAAMMSVGHRGYTITVAGLAELDKRGIPHKTIEELGCAA